MSSENREQVLLLNDEELEIIRKMRIEKAKEKREKEKEAKEKGHGHRKQPNQKPETRRRMREMKVKVNAEGKSTDARNRNEQAAPESQAENRQIEEDQIQREKSSAAKEKLVCITKTLIETTKAWTATSSESDTDLEEDLPVVIPTGKRAKESRSEPALGSDSEETDNGQKLKTVVDSDSDASASNEKPEKRGRSDEESEYERPMPSKKVKKHADFAGDLGLYPTPCVNCAKSKDECRRWSLNSSTCGRCKERRVACSLVSGGARAVTRRSRLGGSTTITGEKARVDDRFNMLEAALFRISTTITAEKAEVEDRFTMLEAAVFRIEEALIRQGSQS